MGLSLISLVPRGVEIFSFKAGMGGKDFHAGEMLRFHMKLHLHRAPSETFRMSNLEHGGFPARRCPCVDLLTAQFSHLLH